MSVAASSAAIAQRFLSRRYDYDGNVELAVDAFFITVQGEGAALNGPQPQPAHDGGASMYHARRSCVGTAA